MANESEILWVDVENNALLAGWEANTTATIPVFKQGDNIKVEIHFVKRVSTQRGIFFEEVPTAGSSFKLAVGNPDTLPNGGFWTLSFGGDFADFIYNESAATMQLSLNTFPSIIALGGVTVEKVNGDTTYRISFNEKVALPHPFAGDPTNLLPSSTVIADEIKVGSTTTKGVWHIKSVQVPIAYQSSWTPQSSAVITATAIQLGTTRVKISPTPKDGTFSLSVGTATTAPISVFATELEVQNAITDVVTSGTYEVKKSGSFIWDVSQTSGNLVLVTADGSGLISFDAVVGELNFNNYETSSLLAGATTKNTTLEIEMTTGATVATVLQTRCTIVANLIGENVYAPTPFEEHLTDAPEDGNLYARQNGEWVSFQEEDNQGITIADADARYLQQVSNLADLDDASAGRTNLGVYSTTEVDTALSGKANSTHTHIVGDVTGLQTALDGKADLSGASFTGDVTTTSRMAIGGSLAVNPLNKLAIYDGNIVFSAGYGLAFGDGTTQTTAPTPTDLTGYATESWVTSQGYATQSFVSGGYHPLNGYPIDRLLASGYTNYYGSASATWNITYYDPYAMMDYTIMVTVTAPEGEYYQNWVVAFTENYTLGTSFIDTPNRVVYVGVQSGWNTLQDALNILTSSGGSGLPSGWVISFYQGGSPYVSTSVLVSSASLNAPVVNISGSSSFVLTGGVLPELTLNALSTGNYSKVLASDATGIVRWTAPSSLLSGYALLSGATFTGKVSTTATATLAPLNIAISPSAPASTVAGDIWVGTNNLFFKDSTNTQRALVNQNTQNTFTTNQIVTASTTLALLRLTQTGTGHALVVEDATNPDTTSTVIDANGNLGIGVDPSTWAATAKLQVVGKILTASSTTSAGLNLGSASVAPTTPVQGDVWMASNTDTLRYRGILTNTTFDVATRNASNTFLQPQIISNPSTATLSALRINNLATAATAHSLVVEDDTNPDATSFIINNAGNVGIGVPTGWTPTNKVEIVGAVKADSITFDGTTQFKVNSVTTHGTGANTHDLLISYNGSTYRVPMIFVSTP